MTDFRSPIHNQVTMEPYLERQALIACQSPSLAQCLQTYNIAQTIEVIGKRDKRITLHAADITNTRTMKKFLQGCDLEDACTSLKTDGPVLIEQYQEWLLHEYTDRYRWITTETHRLWLEQVVTLVVTRYIMRRKHEKYLVGDHDAFADAGVAAAIERIFMINNLLEEMARTVHHILKTPEQSKELLDQFCEKLVNQIKDLPPLTWELLPSVPGEIPRPFLLLNDRRNNNE